MKQIYPDNFYLSLLIAFICLISSISLAQTNSKVDLGPGPAITDQDMQDMMAFGSDAGTNSSTTSESVNYTAPLGTAGLDANAQKEKQTIAKDSSNRVSGAKDVGSTANKTNTNLKADPPGLLKPLLSLFGVLALIVIIAWLIKKYLPGQANTGMEDIIQVIGRVSVDTKNSLCLAKFGNEMLLLGVGADGIRLIEKVSDPDKIASMMGKIEASRLNSISKSFSNVFKNARGDYLDDNLEDEEIIEEFDDTKSFETSRDDELTGLLNKVRGLSKMKQNRQ